MPKRNVFYVNKGSCSVFNMLGEVSDELLYGWQVTAVGEAEDGRIFCKTDYGYAGYVDTSCLEAREYRPTHRVKSAFCDILPSARYLDVPLDTLPMGAYVRITEKGEKFSRIEYRDGEAFVPDAHLEAITSKRRASPHKIIAAAKKYLGTPYRWSGKSPLGIDCSGLCFMAYYLNGIKIYRDARFPFYSDYEITCEKLRPADLVFFKGHVALYLGRDKIIHSNAKDGKVVISPLEKSDILACASLYDIM